MPAGVARVRRDKDDWEDTALVNYHRLTGGSRASFACYAAIGGRNCRELEGLKVTWARLKARGGHFIQLHQLDQDLRQGLPNPVVFWNRT